MHPWEDFAETWAHYLHIVDTLEMAYAFGLRVSPRVGVDSAPQMEIDRNPYGVETMGDLIGEWLPVVFAVNSLNRSMGQQDLYPFVLSPNAIAKMDFVSRVIRRQQPLAGLGGGSQSAIPKEKSLRAGDGPDLAGDAAGIALAVDPLVMRAPPEGRAPRTAKRNSLAPHRNGPAACDPLGVVAARRLEVEAVRHSAGGDNAALAGGIWVS